MKGANSPWRELRRRCKTGRSSPGILFRRSLAYAVAVAMGNITVIRIGLGKTRRLRRERGKRASNDDCDDDSLNAQKKEGAMEGGGSKQHGSRSLLPSPKVWHGSQKSTSRRKKAIYLWQQQQRAERNRTAAVFCWFIVGRSREQGTEEGRRGARNQSSITICR